MLLFFNPMQSNSSIQSRLRMPNLGHSIFQRTCNTHQWPNPLNWNVKGVCCNISLWPKSCVCVGCNVISNPGQSSSTLTQNHAILCEQLTICEQEQDITKRAKLLQYFNLQPEYSNNNWARLGKGTWPAKGVMTRLKDLIMAKSLNYI